MTRELWTPPLTAYSQSAIGRFSCHAGLQAKRPFGSYEELWRWSTENVEEFWSAAWSFFALGSEIPPKRVLASREMPGARWFQDVELNYASRALVGGDGVAVIGRSEHAPRREISRAELAGSVGAAAAALRDLGVRKGDRVVAYLPNVPEAVVAFLAAASIGAIWSSCPPDFGTRAVLDRFGQLAPVLLIASDGYRYGGRSFDRRNEIEAIRSGLPSLRATAMLRLLDPTGELAPGMLDWKHLAAGSVAPEPVAVSFDHPLWVLFSSGTTGLPKAIVHSHGGILLEHLKGLSLHCDLGPGERFFWYSSTGWMMWNFLVSGLLVGATIVLYDGSPTWPDSSQLWRLAAEEAVTFFGTSAPYLMACRKAGLTPARSVDLSSVRAIGSTASPLPPEGFSWVYEHIGSDLMLSSMSGGTDICSCLVGGAPTLPVSEGEIPCRWLGAAVAAFDEDGVPVVGKRGELVVTEPLPSMPTELWGDADGSRYRAAYFERFPGVWAHGDWITLSSRGSVVISGRSDATLNRGGVRMGSSELYAVVEDCPHIADSLVVHLESARSGRDELVLFVVTDADVELDEGLRETIKAALRRELSPRHVPDAIVAVPAIPRTLTGKKLEIPVKHILEGSAPDLVANPELLSDSESLAPFVAYAATRSATART